LAPSGPSLYNGCIQPSYPLGSDEVNQATSLETCSLANLSTDFESRLHSRPYRSVLARKIVPFVNSGVRSTPRNMQCSGGVLLAQDNDLVRHGTARLERLEGRGRLSLARQRGDGVAGRRACPLPPPPLVLNSSALFLRYIYGRLGSLTPADSRQGRVEPQSDLSGPPVSSLRRAACTGRQSD